MVLMEDNNCKIYYIIEKGDKQMANFLDFIQDLLMIKKDGEIKVGLTQFKKPVVEPIKKEVSIRTKDVKLSDLMRRAS